MRREDLPAAAALLGLAYRDNPLTIALYGEDPDVCSRSNEIIFGLRIAVQDPPPLVVRDEAGVAGVCGFDPPGGSQMSDADRRTIMETMVAAGPGVPERAMEMLSTWGARSPKEPHWHLGPVGVQPALHGRGIGSDMLRRFCEMMDERGDAAYLETDSEANARLYEKFGFVTLEVVPVIGVPMWLMLRRPAP